MDDELFDSKFVAEPQQQSVVGVSRYFMCFGDPGIFQILFPPVRQNGPGSV